MHNNTLRYISNLVRLTATNRLAISKILLKRALRIGLTDKEFQLKDFYSHLIRGGGVMRAESSKDFVADYPNLGLTLKTRKRPSSDTDVFDQLFNVQEYKPVADAFRMWFPRAQKIIMVDAGSNIGMATIYFALQFPGSSFINIEPDAENYEILRYNLKSNGINSQDCVLGGVWSKNASLKILRDFRGGNDWALRVEESIEPTPLQAFSMGYLLNRNSIDVIDILKIDIEGSEKEVITSPRADVSYLERTRCIAIEIHDEFECRSEIVSVLHRYGFELFDAADLTIGINKKLAECIQQS